ncbi:hypothetical protein Q8G42_11145 [Acinetobacter lwoffii]|uniref:Uncharacterized protein n=1 Tax=Acinetobacter lwoffii TaxID=28090 RepID=A0A6N1MX18_ACILW|nr:MULTISPECIES: hypothetical protein [Pseudomonadota]MCU4450250.1 hypothetical protein [Acinetobacter lwoffii]MDP1371257.1 hypothetical protein [Acinetobacter lwoffii]MDP1390685.1 hypothetical protein [Acinetobacter lwoffii]MDP1448367.1 hypothetical protein [Acinetobacter lwoffii]NGP42018.1 hypothetical protein [Acinetobacter lwoffii]
MLHQKMIDWTVLKWRGAHQEKQLALNHLAQRITHVEVGDVWISVATAAPLQAKIDAFKKAVFVDGMHQRLRQRAANIVDSGFIGSS